MIKIIILLGFLSMSISAKSYYENLSIPQLKKLIELRQAEIKILNQEITLLSLVNPCVVGWKLKKRISGKEYTCEAKGPMHVGKDGIVYMENTNED